MGEEATEAVSPATPRPPAPTARTCELVVRGVGLMVVLAFASLLVQLPGLLGHQGVLPVAEFMPLVERHFGGADWLRFPCVFWLGTSDGALTAACVAGMGCGLLAALVAPPGLRPRLNSYGLFATMTTTRPEIVVEGSLDGVHGEPYVWRWKPGDPARRPGWNAPHQPRLDWQLWFAALGGPSRTPWFPRFMQRLMERSPPVLDLIEREAFPGRAPAYLRALLYEYRFTRRGSPEATGAWWTRELRGRYGPVLVRRGPATPTNASSHSQ